MNPLEPVLGRWKAIAVFVLVVGVLAYIGSSHRHKVYSSTALAEIVPSSEQSGDYLDPNTLDEITNVYLEVAGGSAVMDAAARLEHVSPAVLEASVVASVPEPGLIGFTAKAATPGDSVRYADAVSNSFVTAVASQSATESDSRVTALNERVAAIERQIATLRSTSPEATADLAQLSTLQSDLVTITSTPTNAANVIQAAQPPSSPSSPRPLRDALILAVLALVLSPAVVYIVSILRSRYENPEQATTDLGLPLIAVLPSRDKQQAIPMEAVRLIDIAVSLGSQDRDTDAGSVTLLVSAAPGDGKTFIARSLIQTLNKDRRKAIFVDGDLYKRDLAPIGDEGISFGLADLLVEPGHINDFVDWLARRQLHQREPRVQLISGGRAEGTPGELLSSDAMAQLMRRLKSTGLPVYIDTPAILPATDALVLSRYATDVLLVVHASRTRRRDAAEALRRLESVGAPVRGIIFNAAGRQPRYPYGYGRQKRGSDQPGPDRPAVETLGLREQL
jgi:Mrp family chromosome partitioning ATPase